MEKTLNKLRKICEIQNQEDRMKALSNWINENTYTVEREIKILHRKQLSLEEHDLLCENLVSQCVEELIEQEYAKLEIKPRSYTVKIQGVKVE